MPAQLVEKYHTFLAQQFLDNLNANTTVAYIFIGRPETWSDAANNAVNDSTPPQIVDDTQHADFEYWRDLLGIKRAAGANARLVVPRIDWASNTVYSQYDDTDAALSNAQFYVLDTSTTPYNVYKCLWNNHGGFSNVAPSVIGTSTTPVQTADGYVWQYLYTIAEDEYTWLTSAWMPVLSNATLVTSANTNAGKLPTTVPLVVTLAGAGYVASNPTTVTIVGDGSGATVAANGVSIVGGAVQTIILATGGTGYTHVTSINVYQAGISTAAQARVIIPPYPNHGHDPTKELFTKAVMLTVEFIEDESAQLTTVNDFRRIGLLISPTDANGAIASADFYRHTTNITISANTAAFLPDDVLVNITKASGPTCMVVDTVLDGNSAVVLRTTSVEDMGEATPFSAGDVLKCLATNAEATVGSISGSQLTPFSGSIVYVNQRTPITRDPARKEQIKLVLKFDT